MTGQCTHKRTIIAVVAVALFTWAFDFLVHGNLLMPIYESTKEMWRPMEEMEALWPLCILYHFVMAGLVATAYGCCRAKSIACDATAGAASCHSKKGICFGVWVGLLLGIPQLMTYVWMPIPLELSLAWGAGELVKWTISGFLLSKIHSCCEKKSI
jgi:hypothetical protein